MSAVRQEGVYQMARTKHVVILQHAQHKSQVLTQEARELTVNCGKVYRKLGLPLPTLELCSPKRRCTGTNELFMFGAELAPTASKLEPRLSDWADDSTSGGEAGAKALKAKAEADGMEPEEYLLSDLNVRERMIARGFEGGEAIDEALDTEHDVILVGSHGGSRIEVTIGALARLNDPTQLGFRVERSGIVLLTFEEDESMPNNWKLADWNNYGVLADQYSYLLEEEAQTIV